MNKQFLLEYLNTDSPSSNEVEAQKIWINEVKNYCDEIITDNYGNSVAKIFQRNNTHTDKFNVVIDAHCDEIGWLISRITDDGFIYVKRNGGTDNTITPGQRVRILTESGNKIDGFFGWIPIHLKDSDKPESPTEDNIYIDVAASSKSDVEKLGIEVGNFVVVKRESEIVNDKYIIGKSIDDKIGGFIHSEVLKRLKEENINLPYDLYVVNSVQEEVGLYGAKMITETIKPDLAICFDVCFDTNAPMIKKDKHGDFKMGEGVVFRQGKDVHINLLRHMKKVAIDNEIPYKVLIGGAGGTNTFSYYLSNGGVVTSTLSIPLRGMHTPNEMVNIDDVQTAIDYYVALLKSITYKQNFKLV
jgi:tetrahedral aminopeptidase